MSECAEWRGWMWKRLIVALSLCVYCISHLRFSDIGVMAEVDEQRVCMGPNKIGCVLKAAVFYLAWYTVIQRNVTNEVLTQ